MVQPHIVSLSARVRLFHQWVVTRLWRISIYLADKDRWRDTTICDISPNVSKTSLSFRRDLLKVLSRIERVDPGVANLIAKHVRYITNAFLLQGPYNYYYVDRLLLVDIRGLDESLDGAGGDAAREAAIARCLIEGTAWGQVYSANFTLLGDREAAGRQWDQQRGQIDSFEARMAAEISANAAPTA